MGVNTLISIGNSDDKLSQAEWSCFVMELRDLLHRSPVQIHGEWFSLPDQPWQNANWCVEVLPPLWWRKAGPDGLALTTTASMAPAETMRDADMAAARRDLKEAVRRLCFRWRQDSFAWTTAPVELVETGYVEPTASDRWRAWAQDEVRRIERAAYPELNLRDAEVAQAQREGWIPQRAQLLMDDAEMKAADLRRLPFPPSEMPPLGQPTPGADKDSAPQQPGSTGDGEDGWCANPGCLIAHQDGPCVPASTGTTSKHAED